MRIRNVIAACTAIVATVMQFSIADAIRVCGKCSYEIQDGAKFCGNCGEPASPVEKTEASRDVGEQTADAVPAPDAGKPDVSTGITISEQAAMKAIEEDIAAAREFAATGFAIQARPPSFNARAIIAVAGADKFNPATVKALGEAIAAMQQTMPTAQQPCRRCKGKGQIDKIHTFSGLDGKTTTVESGKIACPSCSGSGKILSVMDESAVTALYATAKKAFNDRHIMSGRKKIGNAWVPPDFASAMTLEDEVKLRSATADPCPRCTGYGKTACGSCSGSGRVKCNAKDCRDGIVTARSSGGAKGGSTIESTVIRNSAPAACTSCNGTGMMSCHTCTGSGAEICKACSGSGESRACGKCRGEGLESCFSCRGTGKRRQTGGVEAECQSCGGKGKMLCGSCGGDGHGRK